MTPSFVPIIGKDFDSIAGQQQFWAGHNQRQDEANLSRAQAAEQARNSYLQHLAGLQYQDSERQNSLAERAYERAVANAQFQQTQAEHAREFGISDERQREAIGNRDKWLNWHYDRMSDSQNKNLDAIDKSAQFLSPDVQDTGAKKDDAEAEFARTQDELGKKRAQIEAKLPPGVVYDPKNQSYRTSNPTKDPTILSAIAQANQELADSRTQFNEARTVYQLQAQRYAELAKTAQQNGLLVGKQQGKHVVFSPRHNKVYGADDPESGDEADGAAPGEPVDTAEDDRSPSAMPTAGTGTLAGAVGPAIFSGGAALPQTDSTGNADLAPAPAPVSNAGQARRIGKYLVTPAD